MVDQRAEVIAIGASMGIASIVAVALRFKARIMAGTVFGLDDWLIIPSLFFTLCICAANIVAATEGRLGGRDFDANGFPTITINQYIIRSKAIWSSVWLSAFAAGFTKVSILLFYRRIFKVSGKVFSALTWILIGLSAISAVMYFFLVLLACNPISDNWALPSQFGGKRHCLDTNRIIWSAGYTDTVIDALILTLPWYPVHKLQMPLRKKILIIFIFLLGGLVVGAGIVRIVFLRPAFSLNQAQSLHDHVAAVYWGEIEVCVGVISACLPTLWPLFSKSGFDVKVLRLYHKLSTTWSRQHTSDASLENGKREYHVHDLNNEASDSSLVRNKLPEERTWDGIQMHHMVENSTVKPRSLDTSSIV